MIVFGRVRLIADIGGWLRQHFIVSVLLSLLQMGSHLDSVPAGPGINDNG